MNVTARWSIDQQLAVLIASDILVHEIYINLHNWLFISMCRSSLSFLFVNLEQTFKQFERKLNNKQETKFSCCIRVSGQWISQTS